MNKISFGERLRQLRDEKDYSLRELADKVGVSAAFLSDIELGRRFPAEDKLVALAKALSIDVATLKEYDFRDQAEEIKKMMFEDATAGVAFRTIAQELKRGNISPEEVVDRLRKNRPRKK